MRKLVLIIGLLMQSVAYADIDNPLNFEEADGSPTTFPYKVIVSNATLTDNADGTVTLTTGGGGGTPGGANANIQYNDASSFGGDGSLNWNPSTNMLGISRDASQSGYALSISGDLATQGILANISHDGTAHFQAIQLNNPLSVDQGGTAAITHTDGGVLIGKGTAAFANTGVLALGTLIVGDAVTNPATLAAGSNGQILSIDSTTATDLVWITPNPQPYSIASGGTGAVTHTDGGVLIGKGTGAFENTGVLAKGTIIVGDGTTNPTTLVVGADGRYLSSDSSTASGLVWATPPAAGAGSGDMILASAQTNTGVKTFNAGTIKFPDVAYIADANDNEILSFDTVTAAVNYLSVANSATGTNPVISADGSDTNVGIGLNTRGTGGVVITASPTATQSTITSGLVVNNGQGATTAGSFYVLSADGARIISSDPAVGGFSTTGKFISSNINDLGWTFVDGADNTTGNAQCVSACVFGIANATGTAVTTLLTCSDVTADSAICAGPN